MRFGIIGCGRIAEKHIATLSQIPEISLVALSDLYETTMERAEALYQEKMQGKVVPPISKYQEYRALLADENVEVVIIATSSGLHSSIAKEALYAGKHLVLEKPMTLSLKEADDLIALAAALNRTLLICHQLRYRPIMQKIKQYVDTQALGSIYLGVTNLRIFRPHAYYEAAPWRGSWREDGGMLLNQGIHMIDLLQWFLGDVKTVYGDISKGPLKKETEDVAIGLLTFANGAKGMIEANTITYPNNMEYGISLFGEHGTISIGGAQLERIYRWQCAACTETEAELTQLAAVKDEHLRMYRDFLQQLSTGSSTALIDGREGKKALETIFALYQSAVTSRPVTLPLPSFSTADMERLETKRI